MSRIFIAINLPEPIKNELENLAREINGLFPEESRLARLSFVHPPQVFASQKLGRARQNFGGGVVRWLKGNNLHLTLLFIGSVKEDEVAKICQIAKTVVEKQRAFSLRLKRVCYGPPEKMPPRLVWIDLEKEPKLLRLAEELKQEMVQAGLLKRFEERPFSPHITLGRIKTWPWRQIEPEERPDIERELDLEFEVNSIEVMESVLKRGGAEYKKVSSFKFQVS